MSNIFSRSRGGREKETARAGVLPAGEPGRGRRYGLALLLVVAAAAARWALPEVLGPTPYLAFYLAWVGAAAFGGLGPGLLATAASWLCVDLLFDTTPWQTTFGDPATLGRLVFYLASGTAVSLVAERMRRGRIAERWQTREAGRAKQEWERTFDAVPDLISIVDRQYRILRVNRAMAERLGVPPERCIGLTCYQCVHDLNAPPALCPHTQCRADGRPHTAEIGDERSGYFLVTCTPLFDPDGQWVGSVHVARDITARRQADQALREDEERLRAIFDHAGVGLAEAADGRFVAVNGQFCRILGYAPDELLGKTVHELTAPEDRALSDALNARLVEGRTDRIDYEKRYLRRDGTPVWTHVTVSAIHDPEGRHRRAIATVEDISERKQAEEALRESEAGLAAAQRLAQIGSWQWNIAADTARWSEETFRIFGIAPGPLSQHRENFLARIVPEDRQRVDQALSDALSGARDYNLDYRIRLPDGREKVIHAQAQVWRSDDGRPLLMHGTVQDITERKRVEEALRELNATLETKVAQRTAELEQRARQLQRLTLELSETEDRERQRMAEILHDDLQQVLAAAKFHLNLLRKQVPRDSSLAAAAGRIDQMLKEAIEKSRSLSHELHPAVLHHGDFTETLRWLARQAQIKHGLAVHVQARGPVPLRSDTIQSFLYKAAQELLFNVVKHAQVQEARIRVRWCGRSVCLSVSDRGHGFDPRELRKATGFGLLSIRERVELLGGRMKINSAVGQGSRFMIVVPAGDKPPDGERKRSDETKAAQKTPSSAVGPALPARNLRVLVADDHEVVRQGLASLLREEDAVEIVGEATNGREAVSLAGRLRPDVVVMDVSMPVMSGDEAARQIKKDLPGTRIIALSMWDESDVRERMYRAGAESYVLKTAPSEELVAAIRGRGPAAEPAPRGR